MSKILAPKSHVFAALVLILQFFTIAGAQDVEIRLTIKAGIADIKGTFTGTRPERIWFLDQYGDEKGLIAERLSEVDLVLAGKDGPIRQRKRISAGEVIASANLLSASYRVSLKPRQSTFAAAHLSWLTENAGLLMLDDLLPQMSGKTAKVTLDVPSGWKVVTSESEVSPGVFSVQSLEKSVFYIGQDLRVIKTPVATLVISGGDWHFKDAEAVSMITAIANDYSKVFGPLKSANTIVRISEFPVKQAVSSWEADTRGRSITIVSSDMPFKNQSIQRLHEQLRHELFHLWVPGRLNLTGRYDWFYEGFALYQSLKTGVASNQIRFEDFLDTLSRARSIDGAGERRASLLELSSERWAGGNTRVYARGMLAAFATDLAMLRASNGKRSVTDLIAAIVRKHSPPAAATEANAAILSEMRSRAEIVTVVDKLIVGGEKFDFSDLLIAVGLEVDRSGSIKMVAKPNGKQRDMLKRLGSENWRNIRRN